MKISEKKKIPLFSIYLLFIALTLSLNYMFFINKCINILAFNFVLVHLVTRIYIYIWNLINEYLCTYQLRIA